MEERKKRRQLTPEAALEQLRSYCAYQDRCHEEVRTRLLEYQVYGDDLEQIIAELIEERFLDEERFAKSYARGKFRIKKWGKLKIQRELKSKRISEYCIKKGMAEIDLEDYYTTLKELVQKKDGTLRETDYYKRRQKLTEYAMRRGFEYDLISEAVREVIGTK